jgi:hypothetical protein
MNQGHVNDLTRSLVAATETRRAVLRFLANGALGGAGAMVGGLLWTVYGVVEMLQPWGQDTVYRHELGYEVIIDPLLYWGYSVPGSLALLLTTSSLLGIFRLLGLPVGRTGRAGLILAYSALTLAVLSAVGVVAAFDPLFTAPRIFGTLALGGPCPWPGERSGGWASPRGGGLPSWLSACSASSSCRCGRWCTPSRLCRRAVGSESSRCLAWVGR